MFVVLALVPVHCPTVTQEHLFVKEYKAGSKIPLPVVETEGGCLYNDAHFSPDMTFFVLECHGPDVPIIWLYRTKDNQRLAVLNDNNVSVR
jgi:hypothetical protein